jgi:hypothetical protein
MKIERAAGASPGPFRIHEKSVGYTEIKDAQNRTIAVVRGQDSLPAHQADVKLLTAAFELLGAAQDWLYGLETLDTSKFTISNQDRIARLKAAVRLATDEPIEGLSQWRTCTPTFPRSVTNQLAAWWPERKTKALLLLGAEHSGKTTLSRAVATFFPGEPNVSDGRRADHLSHNSAWIFENVETLSPQCGDAIAMAVTQGGILPRVDKICGGVVPGVPSTAVILCGSDDSKLGMDVKRRCVVVELPRISPGQMLGSHIVMPNLCAELAQIFVAPKEPTNATEVN